jgi:multidrug resistance efflux pump
VRLLGSDHLLRGRVEGVAAGIEDRDRSSCATLLANVNPTFNWVRLAQRVQVRVALDRAERNELVAGATATVEVIGSTRASERDGVQERMGAPQRLACRAVQVARGSASSCG